MEHLSWTASVVVGLLSAAIPVYYGGEGPVLVRATRAVGLVLAGMVLLLAANWLLSGARFPLWALTVAVGALFAGLNVASWLRARRTRRECEPVEDRLARAERLLVELDRARVRLDIERAELLAEVSRLRAERHPWPPSYAGGPVEASPEPAVARDSEKWAAPQQPVSGDTGRTPPVLPALAVTTPSPSRQRPHEEPYGEQSTAGWPPARSERGAAPRRRSITLNAGMGLVAGYLLRVAVFFVTGTAVGVVGQLVLNRLVP